MSDVERYLWLMLLGPLFWLQAKYVRRITPKLSEPPGSRWGQCGQGPLLRVLIAGDSGAAGVGADSQDQALCGQLVKHLALHRQVQWRVMAVNGLDSPSLVQMLEDAPSAFYDVVVISIGANDLTALMPPKVWLQWQNNLVHVIRRRFSPALLIHCAVPPIHACIALPQPLRWFMGRWANEMNHLLSCSLDDQTCQRIMHWHPKATVTHGLAHDGFHPGPKGYAMWAQELSERILGESKYPPLTS